MATFIPETSTNSTNSNHNSTQSFLQNLATTIHHQTNDIGYNLTSISSELELTNSVESVSIAANTSAYLNIVNDTVTTGILEETPESAVFKAMMFLATYIYPIIAIGGVLCNILSIIILLRPRVANTSVSFYLLVLAFSDIAVLVLDFSNNYFKDVLQIPTIGRYLYVCKVYRFVFNIAFTYSAWLIVAMTVERTLAIWLPLKIKTLTSRTTAKKLTTVILFIIAVINMYNIWGWETNEDYKCDWAKGWDYFHTKVNMMLTGMIYSYIPTITLLICNILISYKICGASAKRKTLQNNMINSPKIMSKTIKITFTVLTLSISYLILTVPLTIYYLIQYANDQFIEMTDEMALGEIIMLMLALINHGINFWLYVFSSKVFRFELMFMIGCKKRFKYVSYVGETTRGVKTGNSSTSGDTGNIGNTEIGGSNATMQDYI